MIQETPATPGVGAGPLSEGLPHNLNSKLIAVASGMALQFKLAGQRACSFRVDKQQILKTLH